MNIGTFEAKTHFSELLDEVQKGKDYTITKRGKPVARIIPVQDKHFNRKAIVEEMKLIRKNTKPGVDIKAAINEGRK